MKRFSILLLLIAGSFAHGQDVQLTSSGGDSVVVKIDKVVVVKEDRLVFRSLPFKLKATPGAADYRWSVPAGVTATEADDVLTITAAPKGEAVVTCRILVVDFNAKVTKRTTESLTFNVGDITPPAPIPPPTPIPPPIPVPIPSALQQSLQIAYGQDLDADRAKSLSFLQAIYSSMAAATPPATNGATLAWMQSKVQAPGVGLTARQVVNLRQAISDELANNFGTVASTPMSATNFAATLNKIAIALKGVQ